MHEVIAIIVVSVFVVLSLIHVYWAFGGRAGHAAAVPEVAFRPAFVPSRLATFAVAVALAICAVIVAVSAGIAVSAALAPWSTWFAYALAAVLLVRAVGDFRLVGFFKRVRGTRFAHLDSVVYAPLCLVLAVAVFYVAYTHRA